MVIAISGADVLSESEGAYMCEAIYKRRCDACGYVPPSPPICVSISPGSNVVHGIYHAESFVCPFCENHQVEELQG